MTTGYRWNIQDRSNLSMICYARLYGRDIADHRRRLWNDLSNLNNRVIVLLPEWEVIRHRYEFRGDEIQDLSSLRQLYNIFSEEAEKIKHLPNVIVATDGFLEERELATDCVDQIYNLENQNLENMGSIISDFVKNSGRKEVSPLNFSLHFDKISLLDDPEIMNHPPEKNYYARIKNGVLDNIEKELSGENEYGKCQSSKTTRRFIFTQDSCVSLIHTMLRDGLLNVHVVCRSSDVINTFPYDLKFLVHMSSEIKKALGAEEPVVLSCAMNSAHIID